MLFFVRVRSVPLTCNRNSSNFFLRIIPADSFDNLKEISKGKQLVQWSELIIDDSPQLSLRFEVSFSIST